MDKVSIIVPSRNELFLSKTVDDLFNKATGEIEVIVVLDGYWPDPPLKERPNLIILHQDTPKGLRAANNLGASVATGKYLMKCDAHCMFAEGFDEVLKNDCDDCWIVVPRRYSLEPESWTLRPKPPIDYHFLDCPLTNLEFFQFHGMIWPERARDPKYKDIMVDDLMSFQGSMWFMHKEHFTDRLGGMSEEGYGTFSQEPQEIGNKTWLGNWDGRVVVNKKTWYAHLHKGKQYGRGYSISQNAVHRGHEYSAKYWMSNSWKERKYNIEYLIDKFWPVPTWPENWKSLPLVAFQPGR